MTLDPRAKDLARLAVDYSLGIEEGDRFLVRGEDTFKPFLEEIGNYAKSKGAKVLYKLHNKSDLATTIQNATDEDRARERKVMDEFGEWITADLNLDASTNPYFLKDVDSDQVAVWQKVVMRDYIETKCKKKWNVLGYPAIGDARASGMDLDTYTDFVYGAALIDWTKTGAEMEKVKKVFDGKEVRILVPGQTDLRLSLQGRGGGVCDGKFNMPDGEVFYGPVETSAQGYITFPYESIRDGKGIENIRLDYKGGEVIEYSSGTNQEFLDSMLKLKGARRIGELGIGCNYGVKDYTKNLLFDEKIGGTVHIAIGNSYEEPLDNGGGKNEGDLHWDLVCDLRPVNGQPGGELYVDDNLVQKDGVWCFE